MQMDYIIVTPNAFPSLSLIGQWLPAFWRDSIISILIIIIIYLFTSPEVVWGPVHAGAANDLVPGV